MVFRYKRKKKSPRESVYPRQMKDNNQVRNIILTYCYNWVYSGAALYGKKEKTKFLFFSTNALPLFRQR